MKLSQLFLLAYCKIMRHELKKTGNILSKKNIYIKPKGNFNFFCKNIQKGKYKLEIIHKNDLFFSRRKSSFVKINTSLFKKYKHKDISLNINYDNKHGAFFYAGGGVKQQNNFYSYETIHIDKNQKLLYLTIQSTEKTKFFIEEFRLIPLTDTEALSIDHYQAYLACRKFSSIEYILYGDIDLSVVDGSSVWMSSMINILSRQGNLLVLCKNNISNTIITSNIENKQSINFLEPKHLGLETSINENNVEPILRLIDGFLPNTKYLYVRGLNAAYNLVKTRHFKYRIAAYLTDFYSLEDNKLVISEEKTMKLKTVSKQISLLLYQTDEILNNIIKATGYSGKSAYLPPTLPPNINELKSSFRDNSKGQIKIGYAGKISPLWGVLELIEWTNELKKENFNIELTIIANKISDPVGNSREFRSKILYLFKINNIKHFTGFNRSQSIEKMQEMDYVWCYRPRKLEAVTLEVSTKLIEMASLGAQCICYPNKINKNLLGDTYNLFIKDKDDLRKILLSNNDKKHSINNTLLEKLNHIHSINTVAANIKEISVTKKLTTAKKIAFAGEDYKFIDAYISRLKSQGHHVLIDSWAWGEAININLTKEIYKESDILFCEWGLANAVWYSNNNPDKKPLYIRIHAQEVKEKARKFGYKINTENVTKFIFVSDNVRKKAISLFNWPLEKTIIIPNYILDDEYTQKEVTSSEEINLGMVGIVPQLKRLDRAINTLETLLTKGLNAKLYIKGHRPEDLPFMHAPGRIKELSYYFNLYKKINENPQLSKNVIFEPWGNDVALWYQKIDYIISSSDSESFHYALADGVLSGSIPIIWPWESSDVIYKNEWVVKDNHEAVQKILAIARLDNEKKSDLMQSNRDFIINKYGKDNIFKQLDKVLSITSLPTNTKTI